LAAADGVTELSTAMARLGAGVSIACCRKRCRRDVGRPGSNKEKVDSPRLNEVPPPLPVLSKCWLSRWRQYHGLSVRREKEVDPPEEEEAALTDAHEKEEDEKEEDVMFGPLARTPLQADACARVRVDVTQCAISSMCRSEVVALCESEMGWSRRECNQETVAQLKLILRKFRDAADALFIDTHPLCCLPKGLQRLRKDALVAEVRRRGLEPDQTCPELVRQVIDDTNKRIQAIQCGESRGGASAQIAPRRARHE